MPAEESSPSNKESASESKSKAEAPKPAGRSKSSLKDKEVMPVDKEDLKEEATQQDEPVKPQEQQKAGAEQEEPEYRWWENQKGDAHWWDTRFSEFEEDHEYPILTKFLLQQRMRKHFFENVENVEEQNKEFNTFKDSFKEKFGRYTERRKYFYIALKNTILIIALGSFVLFCFVTILINANVMKQMRMVDIGGTSGDQLLTLVKIAYLDVFQNPKRGELFWVLACVLFLTGSYFTIRLVLRVEEAKFEDYMMQCERRYRHCVAVQDMRRHDMDNNFDATVNHTVLAMEKNLKKNKRAQEKAEDETKEPISTDQ